MKDLKNHKIVIFGDSIPRGLFIEDNSVRQMENTAVQIIERTYGITIVNRSSFGQTLSRLSDKGEVERYAASIDAGERNVAVFCLGGNDADFDWQAVAAAPALNHLPKTPIEQFRRLLRQKIALLRQAGAEVWLTSIPPVDAQRYFNNIISVKTDGAAVLKFFRGDVTNINRHQECYNNAVMKIALTENCPFIDFRTDFLLSRDFLGYLCDDGVHPNQKGHALMAERIAYCIENYNAEGSDKQT